VNATSYLTEKQVTNLLAGIHPKRVSKDGKGFSHVEAYDIRRVLITRFGFARWDEETRSETLVFEHGEEKKGQRGTYTAWTVCYRVTKRLTVKAPDGTVLAHYDGEACGDAQNQPSRADAHDLALKTAASQAMKRAAVNLGDQFGLSLYNRGSTEPLVKATLVPGVPVEDGASAAGDDDQAPAPDAHLTSPLAPERVEEPQREATAPPPVATPAAAGPSQVEGEGPALSPEVEQVYSTAVAARLEPADVRLHRLVRELMPKAARLPIRNALVPNGDEQPVTLYAFLTHEMQETKRAMEQKVGVR